MALGFIGITSEASAQSDSGFLKISANDSPVQYHPPFNAEAVYLRQTRPNSTVYVARWLDQSDPAHSSNQIYIESVFSQTSPGFAFRTDTPPAKLLGMFEELQNKTRQNGDNFAYQTPIGPAMVLPFARANAQCISFSSRWDPVRADQRGSQLLGYFCEPIAVQTAPGHNAPAQQMTMAAAHDFAADFFLRFDVNLPDNTGAPAAAGPTPAITAAGAMALPGSGTLPVEQSQLPGENSQTGAARTAPDASAIAPAPGTPPAPIIPADQGIGIVTNWNNADGNGALKFDKPAGEGTMIIDDANRHCEGYWRHEGGSYQTPTVPFGTWAVFCTDGTSARGSYGSADPSHVKGDGKDNNGQPVFFRQAGQ
ncbi:hypothetical protein TMES_15175 [Thalassospira mesophila]|uniref:Uncharacterized protein n=1 Tax=Thalassospira mesophila TaxID=1293891 RepID=A0A1Y2L0L5_9PROT|nr:hypothetical protein TMES_15175 [Thalassospira mesophila]